MKPQIIAKEWLGTPFIEGAAIKNVGCDCAGLLEGVFQTLGEVTPARDGQNLEQALANANYLFEAQTPTAGDILLFRANDNFHVGILSANNTIIHAHWTRGVIENRFGSWFICRLVKIYRYLEN